MAAAQAAAAAALAAAAPKKHAAAALQAATAAAQVQVTKSTLLLSGKFFRPSYISSYIFMIFVLASKCFESWLLVVN